MKRRLIYALRLLFLMSPGFLLAQTEQPHYPDGEGYYKDIFLDSGPSIESMAGRQHAIHLGWHWEEFRSYDDGQDRFSNVMVGTADDTNGILLFPDGQPRFRMMMVAAADGEKPGASWIGGGGRHIEALKEIKAELGSSGMFRIQQFVRGGGGYAGFCAGFLMTDDLGLLDPNGQIHLNYPLESFTSTLFASEEFGMDLPYTLQLGGGYYHNADKIPGLTEVGTFEVFVKDPEASNSVSRKSAPAESGQIEFFPALWKYEHPDFPGSGHLIISGGHPERSGTATGKAFMAKLLTYAVAGNHQPDIKTTLQNGQPWAVYGDTGSNDPTTIKIGDGQYHHYRIDIPREHVGDMLRITLTQDELDVPISDLHLFVNKGDYAFHGDGYNVREDLSPGFEKEIVLEGLTQGAWYISVKGATYPNPYERTTVEYTENRHVLNGVGYTLTAEWATTFCDGGLSVADITSTVCPGTTIPLTYTAADCLEAPIRASLLNAQQQWVSYLSGAFDHSAGTHSTNVSIPSNLSAGEYFIQLTSDRIVAKTTNPFTIGDLDGLSVADVNAAVCSGGRFSLTYTAPECLTDPISVALVNDQGQRVTNLSGSFDNSAGTHSQDLNLPSGISAGQYFLRLTSGDVVAETANPFTIGDKSLTDPVQSGTTFARGQQIRLTWQAGCAFASQEQTRCRLFRQGTLDLVFDFILNAPRFGLNGAVSYLDVDPGFYYFEIAAADQTLTFPTFEVRGGSILSLTTDATAFAGTPMNVAWQVDAGISQRSGQLTLRDAGMNVITVLAADLNLAGGSHSTQFTVNPNLLSGDLNGARLHLISADGLTQRTSAQFNLRRNVLSLVNPLPAALYRGQTVTFDYQLGANLPANETLTARWLDQQGTQLYQFPSNLANLAGTHSVAMPLSVGSATSVRLQIISQSGAIHTESAAVSVQNPYMTFNGYEPGNNAVTWQWVGENNCLVDVYILDDTTYAGIALQTVTQNAGNNRFTINAQLVSGRGYSLILATKNRATPVTLYRQFTAP